MSATSHSSLSDHLFHIHHALINFLCTHAVQPTPPKIALSFQDSTNLGIIHLSPTYIWHDYQLSYYTITVTVVNETDHLAHVVFNGVVPIYGGTDGLSINITESQMSLLSSRCSLITLIVTSVSPTLGSSEPANVSVVSPHSGSYNCIIMQYYFQFTLQFSYSFNTCTSNHVICTTVVIEALDISCIVSYEYIQPDGCMQ